MRLGKWKAVCLEGDKRPWVSVGIPLSVGCGFLLTYICVSNFGHTRMPVCTNLD